MSEPVRLPSSPADRARTMLLALCALFTGFYVASNLIGGKLFTMTLFGLGPKHVGLGDGASFVMTAGILAFPLTFVLTDLINEYFGRRTVREFTLLAVGVNILIQLVVLATVAVPTVQFGPTPAAMTPAGAEPDAVAHAGYAFAFAASLGIVIGSTAAFLVGQLLDVHVFSWLRRITGGRMLWLRAQVSTLASQVVDTVVVIVVAFVVVPLATGGEPWGAKLVATVCASNYLVKFVIAVGLTPLLYAIHAVIDGWIGHDHARAMAEAAHAKA